MNNHQARKRFGQHFLVDSGVVDRIVGYINPRPDDNLVEIGPAHLQAGQGHIQVKQSKRNKNAIFVYPFHFFKVHCDINYT